MQWYEAEVHALETATARVNGSRPPVFYGSSSFRLWTTLAEDIGPQVLNLAFGGSTLEACDHFFARLLPPVHPRSILLYAGDNDLGDGRPVEHVFTSFQSLASKVARAFGPIPFGFVSIKPSPARYPILDRIERLNSLVRRDIESRPGGYFIDVFPAMLDHAGKPRPEFFLADGLHLNRAGYLLWRDLITPYRHRIFTD